MTKKKLIRAMALLMCGAVGVGCVPSLAGCGKKDAIVIMTEELSGLFNPFYATSGTDMDVVGMTQLSMLSTNEEGKTVAGDDLATVVKDYEVKEVDNAGKTESVYTFVIKNDIKYSDGTPLTMNDVLFNMYEYLDPVYTGSSTMYSIDIKGLAKYRLQKNLSENESDKQAEELAKSANTNAQMRIFELIDVFETAGEVPGSSSLSADDAKMRETIRNWSVSTGYMDAVATANEKDTFDFNAQLLKDYEFTLKTFKEELESDYRAAKESYDLNTPPYSEWKDKLANDIFKFFLYEGYITPEYEKVNGKEQKDKIEKFNGEAYATTYTTQEAAINRVYEDTVKTNLKGVLTYWGTAGTLTTQYAADATEILLSANKKDDGSLEFPRIDGIKSLGHRTENNPSPTPSVTVNGRPYKVATSHDANGVPTDSEAYDVLEVTINGVDPKAIYNFGFSVAPVHYYSGREVDIEHDKFGVDYASSSFQSGVIQSPRNNSVPLGAGAYQATNRDNADSPADTEFWSNNVVYYKANKNFMFDVKTEKIQMRVVSSSNAIDTLEQNQVDYITPQFTKDNYDRLVSMHNSGYEYLAAWQLGYGYVGINAGKVPNIHVRRAIMAAMQPGLAIQYYSAGTCSTIDWPMSKVNWAYPYEDDGETSKNNKHTYTQWSGVEAAKEKIRDEMRQAEASGSVSYKIKFTIAGASISDHPTYNVFKQAAEILNDLGWTVEVKADSQALTKLSTGSLEVWAAAWGSTIDPDMYQVYHKNSNATSVYAWGYREIKANTTLYSTEYSIINELSTIIEDARSTNSRNTRIGLYEQAMGLVLDLAVEMPIYQRQNLYAYNGKTIKGLPKTDDPNSQDMNPYSSPLEKIWELELIK